MPGFEIFACKLLRIPHIHQGDVMSNTGSQIVLTFGYLKLLLSMCGQFWHHMAACMMGVVEMS